MGKKSQLDKIRRHLLKGRSITPLKALALFGCLRQSARIWDLRHSEGIPISTDRKDGKLYARYRIDPEWLDEWYLKGGRP